MKKKVALFSLCTVTMLAPPSFSRETTLSGGIGLGFEYNDQISKAEEARQDEEQGEQPSDQSVQEASTVESPDEDEDYSRIVVTPSVKLATSTARSKIEVEYHPSLNYEEDGDNSIDQALSSSANWSISQAWQVNLADTYSETDDPGATEDLFAPEDENSAASIRESESQLADEAGRNQVTTNTATIETTYSYWEDSSANLGYSNEILRNDDSDTDYQDFDRHDFFGGIAHRLNSNYRISVMGDYVIGLRDAPATDETVVATDQPDTTDQQNTASGADTAVDTANDAPADTIALVDESQDVAEYHLTTVLDILTLPQHPLSLEYDLAVIDYEAESQADTEIHTALLGWSWEASDKLTLSLGAGPTYQRSDGGEDSWDYAVRFDVKYQLEKSSFQLSGESGTEVKNFTGTDNNGLTNFWEARAVYSRELLEALAMSLFVSYNYDDQETPSLATPDASIDTESANSDLTDVTADPLSTSLVTEKVALGGTLTYTFWQWYSANLSYTFSSQDGDDAADVYDEHRVLLNLSMHRDFFKW